MRCLASRKVFPACFLLAVTLVSGQGQTPVSPPASEVDEIRREMEALRKDYDRRMQLLEDRLNRLSPPSGSGATASTNAPSPAALPSTGTNTVAVAGAAVPPGVAAFAGATATSELVEAGQAITPVKARLEKVLRDFVEVGGYMRAGYGRDSVGGPQVAFQAPGALSKYRLGNEPEIYAELVVSKNFYTSGLFSAEGGKSSEPVSDKPVAHVQLRGSVYNPYSDLGDAGSTEFGLPEAWAGIANVIESQPELDFWAGERFYRRNDINISDFFFYNMSGAGAGAEGLKLPFGKAAFAWIGAAGESGVSDLPVPDAANQAGYSKANYDLRLYDVPMPLGLGEFGITVAREKSGKDPNGVQAQDVNGVAVTFMHTREKFLSEDGFNKLSLQWGQGPAKTFVSGFDYFTVNNQTFIRPDPSDSWRFRVTEHFVAQPFEHLSISPALVYQYTDFTPAYGGDQHWLSFGVRPVIQFTRNISLALEPGVDWVKSSDAGSSGALFKITAAPQVSLGPGFFSRPVLRLFFTYATWPTEFQGLVGGQDYLDSTHGWTAGAQVEAWW